MAKRSFGTITKVGGSGGVAVAELYNITPPILEVDDVETTNHNQADRFRTFLSTLGNWGTLKVEMAMSKATNDQFKTALFDDTVSWFLSFPTFATPITMTFTGILKKLTIAKGAPIDGKLESEAEIKVSGDITIAGGP